MLFERHDLDNEKLPFIFHRDEMSAGEKDYTHWHENIELLYFFEGKGRVLIDYESIATERGDLFVINSEKLHMVQSRDEHRPVRYYCLIIDSGFCRDNGIPVTDLRFKEHISGDARLEELFLQVVRAFEQRDRYMEAAKRAAVLNLLLELVRGYTEGEREKELCDPRLESVRAAVRYIKEHYDRPMSVSEIARAAGLSESHFSRVFRSVTGYTVVSYVNLVRCRSAAKLLSGGKYKVGEAAGLCGFENLSYFTRTYKQIMGTLPSKTADNREAPAE